MRGYYAGARDLEYALGHPNTSSKPKIARYDWGSSFEVEDGLWRVRLDNTRGTLLVNTYVYTSGGELVVIDPGWPWCLDGLIAALGAIGGWTVADVDAWVYTHTHIDHMGSAALLGAMSVAPHTTWSKVEPYLDAWHTFQDETNDWFGWTQSAFAEPHRSQMREWYARREESGERRTMVEDHGEASVRNARLVEFGEVFEVADLSLECVDARGHDPYHVAFFERERGWLFSGDAVIATPTPISRAMDDELTLYAQTLDRLQALDASLLLPGHGAQRRGDLTPSFDRSRGYVESYRATTIEALKAAQGPIDLYALGLALTEYGKPLEPRARWWVHLALIDSHLESMVGQGEVVRLAGPRYILR